LGVLLSRHFFGLDDVDDDDDDDDDVDDDTPGEEKREGEMGTNGESFPRQNVPWGT